MPGSAPHRRIRPLTWSRALWRAGCLALALGLGGGPSGLAADEITLTDGEVLENCEFLGVDNAGQARIRRSDGVIVTLPMASIRSMRRGPVEARPDSSAAAEVPRVLELLRPDWPHPPPERWPGYAWIPGLAQRDEGRTTLGYSLLTGFGLAFLSALYHYQQWERAAADSQSDVAYSLGLDNSVADRFALARARTYASVGALAVVGVLHYLSYPEPAHGANGPRADGPADLEWRVVLRFHF